MWFWTGMMPSLSPNYYWWVRIPDDIYNGNWNSMSMPAQPCTSHHFSLYTT